MTANVKLTKKQKMWIIIATILFIVLVFSCVMFYIWATIEVDSKTVSFKQLKSKIGKYVIIPDCVEEYATKCEIYFPGPEEGSKHNYGKYTNLTVRNEYFEEYFIDFETQTINGTVGARRGCFEDYKIPYEEDKFVNYYEKIIVDGETYYYQVDDEERISVSVVFNKDDFHYYIRARAATADKEDLINIIKVICQEIK